MYGIAEIVSGLTAAAAVGAAAIDHGLHRRSSDLLARPVYRGAGTRPSVALTFDDGPGPQTQELLEYLDKERLPATFFQSGMHVERWPEITKQIFRAGHEIGNHAYSHVLLSPVFKDKIRIPSPRWIYRELATTQRLLTAITGTPPRLFRPPYGGRWIGLGAVHRRLGLRCVKWTVIGHDWEWPAERIARHTLAGCCPGAIVCLHDGRDVQPTADISEMLAALRLMVPVLRDRGFSFETVSSLLEPDHVRAPVPAS